MSNVCGVPTGPSTPGSPLDTVKKLKANPLLCYCMHAGSAASPQQSSHVQQHNTKQSARGHTMTGSEGRQTASSRTLDEVLKPLKYLQRRVLLLLCWVIEGGELWAPPPNSLDDVLLKKEVTRKTGENNSNVCLQNATIWLWVCTLCARGCSEWMCECVGAWSCRILIREDLESQIIHHLLWADNNTSAVWSRRPTVFVKHVRVTEQQRVRRTVD